MRRTASIFFALALAFAPVLASAQQSQGGGGGGSASAGTAGDVQTADGSGGFTAVTVLTAPHGGLGAASPTAHCVLVSEGASAAVPVCPSSPGQFLKDNGASADPSFAAVSGGGGCSPCTATQTITNGTPNTLELTSSGSTTGSSSVGGYSLTHTLNSTGTNIDAFKIVVTDTAHGAGSMLFNVYGGAAGSTSEFSVDTGGNVNSAGNIIAGSNIEAGNQVILLNGNPLVWSGLQQLNSPAVSNFQIGNADNAAPADELVTTANVSAGTTNHAGAKFTFQGSTSTGTGVGGPVVLATSPPGSTGSAKNAASAVLTADGNQHVSLTSAAAPAITSCGTSPSAVTGSDASGQFTTGTATPTACTMIFKFAYAVAPACLVEDNTLRSNLTSYTISTTAIVLTTAAASSQHINYHCFGA